MIENGKNAVHENDKLLGAIMVLLNISMIVLVGVIVWSIFSIVENSAALAKLINGSFLP